MNKHIALLCLVLLLAGCSRDNPPAEIDYERQMSNDHVVRKGDTLSGIARYYGMKKDDLVKLNDLRPPFRLVIGQRLIIIPKDADEPVAQVVPTKKGMQAAPVSPLPPGFGHSVNQQPPTIIGPELGVQPAQPEVNYPIPPSKDSSVDPGELEQTPNANKESVLPNAPIASASSSKGFVWPLKGEVIKEFGKGNDGINIKPNHPGESVRAAKAGVVAYAGNKLRGFGNVVLIKHDDGITTVYAHLDKFSVQKGTRVTTGQQIGIVGKSGNVTSEQLHFEARQGLKPVNPKSVLSE